MRLGALCGCWQQLQQEGEQLVDFFCEDQDSFHLDHCFSIFSSFCSRFTAAIKVEAASAASATGTRFL